MKKPSIDLHGAEVAKAVRLALKGDYSKGVPSGDPDVAASQWLLWSQSDPPGARVQWAYLSECAMRDRDSDVLDLWKWFEGRESSSQNTNKSARALIEETCPWSYYRRHFFGWFLSRFNIGSASEVLGDGVGVRLFVVHLSLFLLASLAVFFNIRSPSPGAPLSISKGQATVGVLVLAWLLVGIVAMSLKPKIEPWAVVQLCLPRLGAAVGIGYAFLASASGLIAAIYRSRVRLEVYLPLLVVLVAGPFLYVMHHIERRVHPILKPRERALRAGRILLLAVTYALAGLPLAAPVLFSHGYLALPPEQAVYVAWPQVALLAAIALNLGVILQLAWDETPLTEPL